MQGQNYSFVKPKESEDKGRVFEISKDIGDGVVYSEVTPQVPRRKGITMASAAVALHNNFTCICRI